MEEESSVGGFLVEEEDSVAMAAGGGLAGNELDLLNLLGLCCSITLLVDVSHLHSI